MDEISHTMSGDIRIIPVGHEGNTEEKNDGHVVFKRYINRSEGMVVWGGDVTTQRSPPPPPDI